MAEETEGQDTGAEASGADATDVDRWLIIGFVVSICLGLAALGLHYRTSNTSRALCTDTEARCGESQF